MNALRARYVRRHNTTLVPMAAALDTFIRDAFRDVPRIDRISVRAKTVDRFMGKAKRREEGALKYADPMDQIQDQLGARVVVFYLSDVKAAATIVEKYFRPIEEQDIVPDRESEFGYFGKHYVFFIPDDIVGGRKPGTCPTFFELQVKTLFQHAWSEAEHDLGYKPNVVLSADQKRRIAFTSAQAWGADLIFDGLFSETEGRGSTNGRGSRRAARGSS